MEKHINKYHSGKIYRLESPNGLLYIGSTCHPTLAMRKACHKRGYTHWKKGLGPFVTSYHLYEEDENNVEIYLIENFPCNNKDELRSREGYWIRCLDCVNRLVAGQSKKEYYNSHREEILKGKQLYYQENKEKIIKRKLQKYICECGGNYVYAQKARHYQTKMHLKFTSTKT